MAEVRSELDGPKLTVEETIGNKLGQFTELNNYSIPTTNSRFAKLSGVVYITTNSVIRIVPIGTWLYNTKRTNFYDVFGLNGKLLTTDEMGFESITQGDKSSQLAGDKSSQLVSAS